MPVMIRPGDLVYDATREKLGLFIQSLGRTVFADDAICEVLWTAGAKTEMIMLSNITKVNP